MDMLKALAASRECSTLQGATRVAWLLGGDDIVLRKIQKQFNRFVEGEVKNIDVDQVKECEDKLTSAIGEWSGESVLNVIADRFCLDTNPLRYHFDISEALNREIKEVWSNTLKYVRSINKENGNVFLPQDDFCVPREVQEIDYLFELIQSTFYTALMFQFEMSAVMNVVEDIGISQFRASCYLRQYVEFLTQVLQSETDIGRNTNFEILKCIHISNWSLPAKGKTAWDVFETSVEECNMPLLPQVTSMRKPATIPDLDLVDIMRITLGGRLREVDGIQVSVADNLLGVKEVGKDTFSGRISRRRVQLLRCGEDNVLVLPYLNTIVFQLKDDNWVRDYDVEILQPCNGQYNESAIRRASNVMLVFEYPGKEEPVISDSAYRILKRYARRGRLYSEHLRNELLSVKRIERRVDVRLIEVNAHRVFNDNEVMAAALTREMIHDILVTKSDFENQSRRNGGKGCYLAAYFDTFYSSGGIAARDNIDWITGAPLLGLTVDYTLRNAGKLRSGLEMHGVAITRRFDGEKIVVWIPGRNYQRNDKETPTGFIENREDFFAEVIEPLPSTVPNHGPAFKKFKIGGYCKFNIVIGAPPEQSGPSARLNLKG